MHVDNIHAGILLEVWKLHLLALVP